MVTEQFHLNSVGFLPFLYKLLKQSTQLICQYQPNNFLEFCTSKVLLDFGKFCNDPELETSPLKHLHPPRHSGLWKLNVPLY